MSFADSVVRLFGACIRRHQTMPGRLTENGLSARSLLTCCKCRQSALGQQQMGLSNVAEAVEVMASARCLDSPIFLPPTFKMLHGRATTTYFAFRSVATTRVQLGCCQAPSSATPAFYEIQDSPGAAPDSV